MPVLIILTIFNLKHYNLLSAKNENELLTSINLLFYIYNNYEIHMDNNFNLKISFNEYLYNDYNIYIKNKDIVNLKISYNECIYNNYKIFIHEKKLFMDDDKMVHNENFPDYEFMSENEFMEYIFWYISLLLFLQFTYYIIFVMVCYLIFIIYICD